MMRHRDDPNLLGSELVDQAVWKSAEGVASACSAKDCPRLGILQDEAGCPLKLGYESEPKLHIGASCVESCGILQLRKSGRDDDQLHFEARAERT